MPSLIKKLPKAGNMSPIILSTFALLPISINLETPNKFIEDANYEQLIQKTSDQERNKNLVPVKRNKRHIC